MTSVKVAGLIAVLVFAVTALEASPDSENAKMRAIVIRAYGGPDVMKLENVARPEPADDEVLIRVVAASINPVDVAIRKVIWRNLCQTENGSLPRLYRDKLDDNSRCLLSPPAQK